MVVRVTNDTCIIKYNSEDTLWTTLRNLSDNGVDKKIDKNVM